MPAASLLAALGEPWGYSSLGTTCESDYVDPQGEFIEISKAGGERGIGCALLRAFGLMPAVSLLAALGEPPGLLIPRQGLRVGLTLPLR